MILRIFAITLTVLLSPKAFSQFRIVGYIHSNHYDPAIDSIHFEKITHLNIAFINPDSTGTLIAPPAFDSIADKAREYKIKILASLGGGSFNPNFASLLADENRRSFVMDIVKFTMDHQLDGIDVDIENDNLDSNYNKLIAELAPELKKQKKLLTAAVAAWTGDRISTETLKKFDFVNVMSYDQTGPWNKDKPGPHSTFEKANEDLDYWIGRGLKKKDLNLGLPFYGYCFGTQLGESMSFKDITARFPGADQLDQFNPPGGGTVYYNGIPTIQQKTSLAQKKAGGVMIWQLLQDAYGDGSLLTKIVSKIKR